MTDIGLKIKDMADVYGLNQSITKQEFQALRKTNLNGLLNSYADEADVFSEIIQNSFDTILTCINQNKYTATLSPCIKVFIGRRSNDTHYFAVNDNGLGMDNEMMNKFTIPGFTQHKAKGKTVGYKGIGASFFFASSERISIKTIDAKNQASSMTVIGSYSWITNETSPPPIVNDESDFPIAVSSNINNIQGTTICYYFHNGGKPKSLNNIVNIEDSRSNELTNWVSFLCSKTALGQSADISNKKIRILFYLDDGSNVVSAEWGFKKYSKDEKTLGYPFPWTVFPISVEKSLIDDVANKNAGQLIKFRNLHRAIHAKWTKEEIVSWGITDNEDEQALINTHLEWVDVFYCYSTDIFKEIDKRMGCRKSQIKYGIKLIVDNVPQGRIIDFDITSDIGLNRQTHLVIGFKELKLDEGRKIASDENIQEVIRKISVRAMSIITQYKPYLTKKDRNPVAESLEKWKNEIKSKTNTSIVKILFERLNLVSPLQIDPLGENDVISLFIALYVNKMIKGYKLSAISGYNRYDGLIDIYKDDELKDINDHFSIRDNDRILGGDMQVVEFKYQFADLIDNFWKKTKYPNEVNLAICWTLPDLNQTMGEVSYCYDERKDFRPLYGVTHIWTNESFSIPIISLQHFVANYLSTLEKRENKPDMGTAILAQLVHKDKENSI